MDAKTAAYLATLPPDLAALIRPLKVGGHLADALRRMEQADYHPTFDLANARAGAFLFAALTYGDLAQFDYLALEVYRFDMGQARRDFLNEQAQAYRPDPA
ncbi:hypothetical protein E8F11_10435 [Pseudomonas sp. BN417]|uniref:hypothetical protein n=1 Tax=Pseudomonas sp. BN417 TaxID=2567890 RepID=UPI0024537FB7|nr:hypothetical protein [Pseudomonas sp. BN417]MDH4555589.1 hypothetical protein [Pseudomonas sp. BN417]